MYELEIVEMDERNGDLLWLPEDVIGSILSLTTPSEAGRSSAVCRSFNAAAQSDVAWNSFLPSDTDFIISLAKPNDLHFDPISSSKKHIFLSLCRTPLLFDDRTKSFSLEKWSGKKLIMFGARGIPINISNPASCNIWRWEYHPNSRFGDVAVLMNIPTWSRIRGRIDCTTLDPRTYYAAYIVFNLVESEYTVYDINICEYLSDLSTFLKRADHLHRPKQHRRIIGCPWILLVRNINVEMEERQDGWFEIELGLFESGNGYEVDMGIIKRHNSESCFVIHGVEIRPIQTCHVRTWDADKYRSWIVPTRIPH